jgi:hypothetical protein
MAQPLFPSTGTCLPDTQQLHGEAALSSALPATPDVEAGAPCSETPVPRGFADATINEFPTLLDVSFPQPQPLPLPSAETPFQIHEDRPQFDLDFADALPSTNVSLPSPTIIKTAHSLRLPSFDVLGIAAPHPDRFSIRHSHSFLPSAIGAGPLSKPEDPLHALSPPLDHPSQGDTAAETPTASRKAARAQVEHTISTFTPPTEPGTFYWGPLVSVRPAGLGSPPSSDPGVSPNLRVTASATAPGQAPIIVPMPAEISDAVRMAVWIEEAKNFISRRSNTISSYLLLTLHSRAIRMFGTVFSESTFPRASMPIVGRPSLWSNHCCHPRQDCDEHIVDQCIPCPTRPIHTFGPSEVSAINPRACSGRR